MKPVITLDLWLNRLWQHWKVVNAIGFCVCISVFAHKSSVERARCSLRAAGTADSYWLQLFNTPLIGRLSGSREGGHFVSVAQRRSGALGG